VGGGGAPFNLGEASVTRASVRLSSGEIGHAVVLGRDADKAGLAAAFDAAWQNADFRRRIEDEVVTPALALEAEADRRRAGETEATRVDFFTMVRGED
jgi:alpha-D-ribose 1-methylphosphonate 5-triphosphate synthase subunit PhnG